MLHNNPTYRKESEDTGLIESGYKFTDLKELSMAIHTIPGGRMVIDAGKKERVLIIKRGLAYAELEGRTYRLEEGVVLEIPKGRDVKILDSESQVEFYCIANN
jgi:hypothetical protein